MPPNTHASPMNTAPRSSNIAHDLGCIAVQPMGTLSPAVSVAVPTFEGAPTLTPTQQRELQAELVEDMVQQLVPQPVDLLPLSGAPRSMIGQRLPHCNPPSVGGQRSELRSPACMPQPCPPGDSPQHNLPVQQLQAPKGCPKCGASCSLEQLHLGVSGHFVCSDCLAGHFQPCNSCLYPNKFLPGHTKTSVSSRT